MRAEQVWMVQTTVAVAAVGITIAVVWTTWDYTRASRWYCWWWLRDLLGLREEPQPRSPLDGVTIVHEPRSPRRPKQTFEPAPAAPHVAEPGLLDLKADVS